MTSLALINEQTMICENVSTDPRPASEIQISGYIVLDLDQTPTVGWELDGTVWVPVDLGTGQGGIGNTYENGKLVKTKPDDILPQPESTGTQEI